ncbi:sugar ABC transporter permease [Inquilinus sp.]|uniref:carbohydrate ABC transporter permease n=1 Tax=Inquilinus sp. TaxID=1932117 RepID=UPI0031E0C16C
MRRTQPLAARLPGLTPFLLILPSFLLAAFIIAYPVWDLLTVASHQVNRFGQLRDFTGLANLGSVLADPVFMESLWRTLVWTAAVVAGTVLVSVPVALILNTEFHGRGLARVIVMLPWSVSLTMMAIVWRWALNGESGLLNLTLQDLGITDHNVIWLASAATAFPIQILIGILVSVPFTVTIFLGGLSSIPSDIYEAASTDGASSWQRFRTLTLPLMRPFINMAVVLNIIYVFNSFPIIWVLTGGGPSDSTQILVTYLYKLAFQLGKMGEAASISLIMFAILLVFTLIYLRMAMRSERNA